MSNKIKALGVIFCLVALIMLAGCQHKESTSSTEETTLSATAQTREIETTPTEKTSQSFSSEEAEEEPQTPGAEQTTAETQLQVENTAGAEISEATSAATTAEDVAENPINQGGGIVLPDDEWL